MPDDWRDKLAALVLDDEHPTDRITIDGDTATTHPSFKPHYDEAIRANATPPEEWTSELMSSLDRDELHALQSAALDQAMSDTGRTIREPHLTHTERLQRLRGIPAVGEAGGAIKGTRPDHG